jgi:hypothetical protein
MLAKQNNGVFPFGRIYETIDGRVEIKSHGTREMPVFGYRFWPAPTPGFSPQAPYYVDPLYDREPIMRSRILAVIDYLYRIQEKYKIDRYIPPSCSGATALQISGNDGVARECSLLLMAVAIWTVPASARTYLNCLTKKSGHRGYAKGEYFVEH